MMYEALTGDLPFGGSKLEVLADKKRLDPVAPDRRAAGIPADLVALCMELLRRRPEERPGGEEVLRRLGLTGPPHPRRPRLGARRAFIGRRPVR